MYIKRSKGKKLSGMLTLLVIISISFAVLATLAALLPAVSAEDGPVTTNASVNPEGIRIGDKTRVTLTVDCVNATEKVPVDIMHVIDRSESMNWYGDVIHSSSGSLTSWSDWTEIDTFIINSSNVTKFDVLLETNSNDYYQYLQIESPSGVWYGYPYRYSYRPGTSYDHYPGRDYIRIYKSYRVESGTWKVYARGDSGRPYVLAVQVPPIRLDAAKDAATTFVGLMGDQDQIGVVSFNTYASDPPNKKLTLLDTQANRNSVNDSIDSLSASSYTAIGEGIDKAKKELTNPDRSREDALKVMVLLSDGVSNRGRDPITMAQEAANEGIKIFTVGFGEADHESLQDIANITGGRYYYAPSGSDLQEIYKTISEDITAMVSRTHAYYVLPDDVEYAGNATREPIEIIGNNTLRWAIGDCTSETWTVSFDVRPKTFGKKIPVMVPGVSNVTYEMEGEPESEPFPAALLVDVGAFTAPVFSITPCPEGRYIGDSVGISGSVVVSNTVSNAKVSVKLYVDYPTMGHARDNKTYIVDADTTSPPLNVSTTWVPMSSGRHTISIYVYELKADGTEFWTEAQGNNTKTKYKTIYIKKVKK